MSSHHIIRDQQEPAVLIHSIERFPDEVLHSLLEWSPTVVCCEPSVHSYTQQGFKLDFALTSPDNYEFWKKKLQIQHPIKVMSVQESEFLMTGLTLLKKDNHKAVNIVSAEGTLFELIQQCLKWANDLDVVILTETRRHVLQKSTSYKKWLPANSSVSLTPLVVNSHFTTEGFEENLINECLKGEVVLTKAKEGEIVIECNRPSFVVSELL